MTLKRCVLAGLLACTSAPIADAFGFSTPLHPLQLRRAGIASSYCPEIRMAGFGAKSTAKDSKAPKKITGIPKSTLQNFGKVVKEGAKPYKCFARIKGEDAWYEVGEVASSPDSPDAAATIHKRLALEYAADLYPALKAKARQLELGYSSSGSADDDVVVVKKEENTFAKDGHGFLPKSKGPKMGQGLFNINGDSLPVSSASSPTGATGTVNPLGQIVG